jgi:hypothetical protein
VNASQRCVVFICVRHPADPAEPQPQSAQNRRAHWQTAPGVPGDTLPTPRARRDPRGGIWRGPYDPFCMVNILVPQTGHVPLVAGRPFLRTTFSGFLISRFVLHLKQYAFIR